MMKFLLKWFYLMELTSTELRLYSNKITADEAIYLFKHYTQKIKELNG